MGNPNADGYTPQLRTCKVRACRKQFWAYSARSYCSETCEEVGKPPLRVARLCARITCRKLFITKPWSQECYCGVKCFYAEHEAQMAQKAPTRPVATREPVETSPTLHQREIVPLRASSCENRRYAAGGAIP